MGWWTRGVNPPEYDWFAEADKRTRPRTRADIIKELDRYHRFWRLKRDWKWLQKRMRKMGLNPEDARELLP